MNYVDPSPPLAQITADGSEIFFFRMKNCFMN